MFRVHKQGLPERINIGDSGPVPDEQKFEFGVPSEQVTTLMDNIESRSDYHCHAMAHPATMCHLDSGRELYVFTEPGAPSHPSALFRGFVQDENGTPVLKETGWSAVDEDTAGAFFGSITAWPKTQASED